MENFEYKPYIKSLVKYMVDNKYTVQPIPKITLCKKKQEGLFITTGYFDPDKDSIVLFVKDRHPKDVLRTLAHELIHWKQQKNGDIENNGYTSDKITEDEELIKLEKDAYLNGNIAFRGWTEVERKKEEKKRKMINSYNIGKILRECLLNEIRDDSGIQSDVDAVNAYTSWSRDQHYFDYHREKEGGIFTHQW